MTRFSRLAAVLAVLSTAAAPLAAQTNFFGAGSPVNSPTLTGFSTEGSEMIGMDVTWTLATGGSFSAAWADLGAGVCGATFGGFSVTLGCSTNTFGNAWTVQGGGERLASVRFNGARGRTLFDCDWNGQACQNTGSAAGIEGTDGSANGWSLETVGGTYTGGITGAYSNIVSVGADPAVGDLYEQLTINFNNVLGANATYTFYADTDNSRFDAPPPTNVVPEPSTYALMFAGLMGIGAMARRRRNV